MSRAAPYRLLIFDWDGTLLDSIGAIVGCTQAALAELSLPPVADERIRAVIGLGLRETVETICPGCDEKTFRAIVDTYGRLWIGGFVAQGELFDGVESLLGELRRTGYALAVATAKGRRGLDNDLQRTGLAGVFGVSRTVDEAPPKPNPAMIQEILAETGFRPAECLMIGDTRHDLEMAANAGVDAVGVATGSGSQDDLHAAPAVAYLRSVMDLPDWLPSPSP